RDPADRAADADGGRAGFGDELHRGGGDLHPRGDERGDADEYSRFQADDAAELCRADQWHADAGVDTAQLRGPRRAGSSGAGWISLLQFHTHRFGDTAVRYRIRAV